MSYFRSNQLIAAKALARAAHYTPTNRELILARRLAQQGISLQDVHDALGWGCCLATTKNRLLKYNIKPGPRWAHRGFETSLPPKIKNTDMRSYRPKERA